VIVLDASAAVEWFLLTPAGLRIDQRIANSGESLNCPHLFDLEVAQVFRRLAREGTIPAHRADAAVEDLLRLDIGRYEHFPLLPRIWRFRHNFSVYDAAYLALAEDLDATLITCDRHLASAPGHRIRIELF
jgi:predicted nucleic acid-binding protein